MDPFLALAYFITSQSPSLELLAFPTNPTLRFLYSVCLKNMKIKVSSELDQVYNEITTQMQKIIEIQNQDPLKVIEKSKSVAKEFLESIRSQKRKSGTEDEGSKRYSAEDFLFIQNMSEPNKSKNWKQNFNEGKAKGFFASYTSSSSLKSSYHHARKRVKNQK